MASPGFRKRRVASVLPVVSVFFLVLLRWPDLAGAAAASPVSDGMWATLRALWYSPVPLGNPIVAAGVLCLALAVLYLAVTTALYTLFPGATGGPDWQRRRLLACLEPQEVPVIWSETSTWFGLVTWLGAVGCCLILAVVVLRGASVSAFKLGLLLLISAATSVVLAKLLYTRLLVTNRRVLCYLGLRAAAVATIPLDAVKPCSQVDFREKTVTIETTDGRRFCAVGLTNALAIREEVSRLASTPLAREQGQPAVFLADAAMDDDAAVMRTVIGKNADYYLRRFALMENEARQRDALGGRGLSWGAGGANRGAIVVGILLSPPAYFFYRKMYACAFAMTLLYSLLGILNSRYGLGLKYVMPMLGFMIGCQANRIYFFHVKKKIRALRERYADHNALIAALARKGGRSFLAPGTYLGVVVLIVIVGIAVGQQRKELAEAAVALKNGQYARVIQVCDGLLAKHNRNAKAYLLRGMAHIQVNAFQAALDDFSMAVLLEPDNQMALLHRGLARVQAGNPSGALEDFNRVLAKNPKMAGAYFGKALAQQRIGDLAGAIEAIDTALRLEPGNATFLKLRQHLLRGPKPTQRNVSGLFPEWPRRAA